MRNDVLNTIASGESAEARVLLLPPTSKDGDAISRLLRGNGLSCFTCKSVPDLAAEAEQGAAAVIVSEEGITAHPEPMNRFIRTQPVWSDLPILVLSRGGIESPQLNKILADLGNASVVERPVRLSTFITLVRSALRARGRQYEVRRYLAERQALLESESAARSHAERTGHMKDEFLATISHELRTPLNAILGWSQIMHNSTDMADLANGLTVIERNARAQSQIINDLLEMSRIISGKVRLDVRTVNLSTIVQAAVENARPTAEAKGVGLACASDLLPNAIVTGDPNRLQQVMWNLLTNAIKFTPKGGHIVVSLTRVESHLEIHVTDSGVGIAEEFLPYVFDRFRQADGSSTRVHGGLGLGLSIVKQLVELHGGTVSVTSDGAGCGTTFGFTLPMLAVHAPAESAKPKRNANQPQAPDHAAADDVVLSGIRVLVVDDEPDARSLVQRVLEDRKAVVTTASSAEEAICHLKSNRYDVLISDIGMPGENGYSLIERVRALQGATESDIPAIALTAYARNEDRTRAIAAGFQMYSSKPIEPFKLIAMVASATRQPVKP